MNTRDPNYTKTGNSWLSRLAGKLTMIPVIGGGPAAVLYGLDTIVQSAVLLFQGKPLSALTAAGTGSVSMMSAAASAGGAGIVWWGVNVASGVFTGRSIGTHLRKGTEGLISVGTKPLGIQPQVLRAYPAVMGGLGGAMPAGPGVHASRVSQERGRDAQADYAAWQRGEGGVAIGQANGQASRG